MIAFHRQCNFIFKSPIYILFLTYIQYLQIILVPWNHSYFLKYFIFIFFISRDRINQFALSNCLFRNNLMSVFIIYFILLVNEKIKFESQSNVCVISINGLTLLILTCSLWYQPRIITYEGKVTNKEFFV